MLLRCYCGPCTVPRRSWRCRGDPTAGWLNPRCYCGSFEHVQSCRSATAKVCGFLQFSAMLRRSLAEPLRNHCGTTAITRRSHCGLAQRAVLLRMFGTCTKLPQCHRQKSAVLTVCYCDHWRNHCGTTAIIAVPLRFMSCKHRSGTAPPV